VNLDLYVKGGDLVATTTTTTTTITMKTTSTATTTTGAVAGYIRHAQSCVRGHNIAKHVGKSLTECASICSATPNSVAFEYGVQYGGSPYEPGDCMCQDSVDSSGCDGRQVNLDLYVRDDDLVATTTATTTITIETTTTATTTTGSVAGYTRHAQSCVYGHNIAKHIGKSLTECAAICSNTPESVAFEYGVQYGGGPYEPGDCMCQDSVDSSGCDGRQVNLDLYVKIASAPGYDHHLGACVTGHNIEKHIGKTILECATICDGVAGSVAFEYGVQYGGAPYQPGDCLCQDSSDMSGCRGRDVNLDLYVKHRRRLADGLQPAFAPTAWPIVV